MNISEARVVLKNTTDEQLVEIVREGPNDTVRALATVHLIDRAYGRVGGEKPDSEELLDPTNDMDDLYR